MKHPLPFVLAASDHGPMIVSRLDYAQNPHGFYGVGFQILHTGSYDSEEIELVLSILRKLRTKRGNGICALDCGANIGVHTLAMGKEMIGWGKVVAFEPQERLFYALCGNIALANLFNVYADFSAIGNEIGSILVPKPNYTKSGSFGSLELRQHSKTEYIGQQVSYIPDDMVSVPLTSIDALNMPRVDFIKIDVEGMELDVLEGAKATIERDHSTMLIEWIKCGAAEIRDVLIPLGYELQGIGMNILAEFKG